MILLANTKEEEIIKQKINGIEYICVLPFAFRELLIIRNNYGLLEEKIKIKEQIITELENTIIEQQKIISTIEQKQEAKIIIVEKQRNIFIISFVISLVVGIAVTGVLTSTIINSR